MNASQTYIPHLQPADQPADETTDQLARPTDQPADETGQLVLWGLAILFFGFGDTLTSLMVFADGGYESNILLGALLKIIGPTVGSFLAIKALATIGLVAMGRGMHSLERPLSILMLAMGMFLVGNNAVVILFQ
jgi:hypothetical protein